MWVYITVYRMFICAASSSSHISLTMITRILALYTRRDMRAIDVLKWCGGVVVCRYSLLPWKSSTHSELPSHYCNLQHDTYTLTLSYKHITAYIYTLMYARQKSSNYKSKTKDLIRSNCLLPYFSVQKLESYSISKNHHIYIHI